MEWNKLLHHILTYCCLPFKASGPLVCSLFVKKRGPPTPTPRPGADGSRL
jgi:hypothetical protein